MRFDIIDIILIIGAIDILILLNYVIIQIIIGGIKWMTGKALETKP